MENQISKSSLGSNLTLSQQLASVLAPMGVSLTDENMEKNFSYLGLDSMMMMEVILSLEETLSRQLPLEDLSRDNLATPKSLLKFIEDFMNDKK